MIAVTTLHDAAKAAQPQALSDLRMLVEMETPTSEPDRLRDAAHLIKAWLHHRIDNLTVQIVAHDHHGPTIVARREGTASARALLVGHYDTVWPVGSLAEIPFSVTEGIVRGPGVLDMKAGLVTLVHAVSILDSLGACLPRITIVLNADEECGSPSSRAVLFEHGKDATAALILEPGIDWDLKTERKGTGAFRIFVKGIEAHAGNDPDKGASAIHALNTAVVELIAASNPAAGTTINVGLINGGTARNTVAANASCDVDVRVTTSDEMARIDRVLAKLTSLDTTTTLRIEGGWGRPPLQRTCGNDALLALAQEIAVQIRGPLGTRSVGGGSDGNLLSDAGIPVLDGLGASGSGPHARNEHVIEAHMPDRIALLAGILSRLSESKDIPA